MEEKATYSRWSLQDIHKALSLTGKLLSIKMTIQLQLIRKVYNHRTV